jgi:hypothetical protein
LSFSLINSLINAIKDNKIYQNAKRTANLLVAVTSDVYEIWWQSVNAAYHQKGPIQVAVNFHSKKSKIVVPGLVSLQGWRPRLLSSHILGLLGSEGKKTIRCLSYSLNIATVDFFLFQTVK